MKKSIKILVEKLEQDQHGKLSGGFSAIKGGFKSFANSAVSTNDGCTNEIRCSATTNTGSGCTNSFSC